MSCRELRSIGSYLHNMLEQRVGKWKQRATYELDSEVWSSAQSRQVPKQGQLEGFEGSDRLEISYDTCWKSLKLWKYWQYCWAVLAYMFLELWMSIEVASGFYSEMELSGGLIY